MPHPVGHSRRAALAGAASTSRSDVGTAAQDDIRADPSAQWLVTWATGVDSFAEIAPEWGDLHSRCSAATPFQTSAWLVAWCRWYAAPDPVRLVLVRRDGRLVAAAALVVRRRLGLRVLVPAGHGLSDVTDVLLDDRYPEAASQLAAALWAEPGWDVLDLPELRAGSAGWLLRDAWAGRSWSAPGSVCLEMPGQVVEEAVLRLHGRTRRRVRQKLRVIDDAGIDVRTAPAGDVPQALGTLLDLHCRQWAGRGGNPEHGTARFRAWLTEALSELCATGGARIEEYSVDGVVVASEILLVGRDFVGYYLDGTAPELRERVDTSTLYMRRNLGVTAELGVPTLNLLRGHEDYKMRWGPTVVVQDRVLLARHPGRAALLAGAVLGRARLRSFLTEKHPHVKAALTMGLQVGRQRGVLVGAATALRLLRRRESAAPPS